MQIETRCEHCGHVFDVEESLKGGITNCPQCGKATEVAGMNDVAWDVIRIASFGGALVLGIAVGTVAGPLIGAGVTIGALALVWVLFKIGG